MLLLFAFSCIVAGAAGSGVVHPSSLWDRLGGEDKIRALCNDIYDRHAADPLTAPWFGAHVRGNVRTEAEVKQYVFEFFSSGIGGPHAYTGRDMRSVHRHMEIGDHAFHAVAYHVLAAMASHEAGGDAEREEVLGILQSLRSEVLGGPEPSPGPGHPEAERAADGAPMLQHALLVALGASAALFFPLVLWRMAMALDSGANNLGICQWSAAFYLKGGALTEFLNALPYILNLAPLATVFLGIYLREATGNDYLTFATFFIGFVGVPVVDMIIGEDSYNPTPEQETALRENWWFSFHLCLYVWAYVATVPAVAYYVALESGFLDGGADGLSCVALAGISSSLGIASGFGIGCIHELIHRPSFLLLNHGRAVLLLSNYNHFWVEHLFGHHKRVATDEDPASSAMNEPLWTFIWRCMYQSFVSACRLEARFQRARGRGFWCIENRILVPSLASLLVDACIYRFLGPKALVVQLVQSFLTAFLTDNTNYIEHYGLRRSRRSDKKDEWGLHNDYEQPGWMHSWNSGDRLTNWMLFKIQRHPDHHVNAGRPYQTLRTFKESPTYPTGYAGMIFLSWFPPLFFAVMNPLVKKAIADHASQVRDRSYGRIFPKGANNISSVYQEKGADFFQPGSEDSVGVDSAGEVSGQPDPVLLGRGGPAAVRIEKAKKKGQ